ncbi:uncharacterized protein LOC124273456 [Haliotis rubra]|uniref:uncharacterized protein LOC124273456 n=1 Tax=Haliotis rubra TaxID=36100 RepID=UPI001EE5E214|nr:uncharacterized protein LOC124273456 [Haliotis rubra]
MGKSVVVLIYVTYLSCILQPVRTGTTYNSKACYGSGGLFCVRHDVSCNSTQKIAIYDAYYTNNTECGAGISNCGTVNPANVTEHGYHNFSNTELVPLYSNCSRKTKCSYPAPRRSAALAFSVVKYQCIEVTSTGSTVNTVFSTKNTTSPGQTGNNTGAIAGGVVATVVAVLVVTLVSAWIIRQRRANSESKAKTSSIDVKSDMTYSLAGKIQQNNYHEIQDLKTQNCDHDYATADVMGLPPTTNTYFTIEPAGNQTVRDNSTVSAAEGDYNHIGDTPSLQISDYDTTASIAQQENVGEDNYGYNHFQKKANTQTHQNDYDTAASATKAVAEISTTERNTDEDDYDHFHRGTNASDTVSSPYGTTSGVENNPDYSVAGKMK